MGSTKKLDFGSLMKSSKSFIELTHEDINEIAYKQYNTTYSLIHSVDEYELTQDWLVYKANVDYPEMLNDLVNWGSEIALWKRTHAADIIGTDNELRAQLELNNITWAVMLTMLIRDGRLPKTNYLIDISN